MVVFGCRACFFLWFWLCLWFHDWVLGMLIDVGSRVTSFVFFVVSAVGLWLCVFLFGWCGCICHWLACLHRIWCLLSLSAFVTLYVSIMVDAGKLRTKCVLTDFPMSAFLSKKQNFGFPCVDRNSACLFLALWAPKRVLLVNHKKEDYFSESYAFDCGSFSEAKLMGSKTGRGLVQEWARDAVQHQGPILTLPGRTSKRKASAPCVETWDQTQRPCQRRNGFCSPEPCPTHSNKGATCTYNILKILAHLRCHPHQCWYIYIFVQISIYIYIYRQGLVFCLRFSQHLA